MTIREIVDRLDAYVADLEVPAPYWLTGSDADESQVYCFSCAEAAAAKSIGTEVAGGYGGESDSCEHCDTCGRVLDYTLTDAGVGSEIDHFRKVRFRKPLGKEEAYHVARMLAGAEDDPDAIRIATRAVNAIPPA